MKVTRRTGSLVIVLVIFAAIVLGTALAAIAIDKSEIPMLQQHAAEAAGEEYVHGANIGRTPSGTYVNSASAFRTAVNNNQDINLTGSFTISSPNIRSMADYSATIYGNGHTITFDLPTISGTNNSTEDYSGSNYYYCGLLVGTLCGRIYDLNVELTGGSFKTGLHTSGGSKLNTFGLVGRLYTNGNNHGTIENVSVTLNSGVGIRLYSWANSVRTGLGLVAGLAEGGAIIRNVTVENNGTLESGYTTDASSASDIVYNDNGNVELRSASNVVGYFDSWSHTSGTITLDNIIVKGNGKLNGREACNLGTSESGNTINVGTFYNHFVGTFNGAGDTSPGFIPFDGNSTARTIKTLIEYNRVDNTDCVAGYGRGYNASINEKLTLRNTDGEILFDPAAALDESLVLIYRNSVQNNAGSIYIYNLIATNRTSKGGAATTQTYRGEAVDNDVIFTGMPVVGTWNNCDWGRTTTYPGGDGVFTSQFEAKKLDVNVSELTEYDHGYVPNGYTPSGTGLSSTEFFNTFVNIGSDNTAHNGSGDYYLEEDAIITGFTGRNFGGTLDGNGRTIYITGAQSGYTGGNIGGIVGVLNAGTIKNLRIVLVSSVDVTTSATGYTSPYRTIGIGGVAGAITGNALIENVSVVIQSGVELHGTSTSTEKNLDFSVGGIAGSMSGRGRISNTTVQLDGTLYTESPYPFVAGFVGNSEDPNFTSDGAFNYNNIIFKGSGHLSGNDTDTSDAQELYTAAVTITDAVGSNNGTWVKIDGFIYAFNDQPVADGVGYSMYGFVTQNHNGDSSLTSASDPKPIKNGDTTYISASNIFTATRYTAVKKGNDKGNTYWNIPTTAAISGSVTNLDGSTVTPYFRPGSDGNITLVASGTGVSGFNGVLKEKGATIGEGKDSIPAAAKDGDNLVLEMPKADVASASDTSVGLEEAKTVTLTTDTNKSFTYSGSSQARDVYLKYGESSISDYTVTYAAESGSELSNGSPVNAGSYYISVVALNENAGDYYFFDAASNTLSKSYTYASADENINKFVIKPAEVELAFVSGSMTVTYDAKAVENPEVSVSEGTFGLDDLGELTYVWMNVDGPETLSANPKDAGSYKVKISAVANPNFTVGGAAASGNDFTIKAKEVTLSVEEGGTSFAFAQDTGALTDENYEDIGSYSFSVTGFVEGDDDNSGYTVSITTTEGDPDPSFITENTTGTSYLSAGVYTATVILSSRNYTFGEGKKTFTVTVNENSSANKWLTEPESIISDLTYYSEPDIPTVDELPVPRFGNASVAYRNAGNGEVTPSKTLDVGTYTAVVTVSDDSAGYNGLKKEYSFEVSPLTLTSVTLSGSDTTYDTAAYEESNISIALRADSVEYNSDEDIKNLLGTVTWEYKATGSDKWSEGLPTDAAEYTFRIKSYTNSSNVALPSDYQSGTFTISPKTINFTAALAKNAKLVYGTEPEDKTALVSVTPTVEDVYKEDFTEEFWSYEVALLLADGTTHAANTPAGIEVTLSVTVTISDRNYSLGTVSSSEPLTLVIQKADIGDITIATEFTTEREEEDGSVTPGFVYGAVTAPLTFNGIPKDVKPTIVYTKGGAYIDEFTDAAEAGDYIVKVTINDNNYNEKEVSFEFFIDKADRSVTVTISGWTYRETANTPDIDGIEESAIASVTYTGTTNAGDEYNSEEVPTIVPTEAGTYTVTVKWDETTNYTAGEAVSKEFIIKRATGFANISVNGTPYTETVTAYYTGSAQTFTVTVEGHDGGEIYIDGNHSSTMDYGLTDAGRTTTVKVTVAQTANYNEATATAEIEILPAVIQSVTLKTTKFAFGTLNTENANDAATYGTAEVAFVDGKGSGSPEFNYSLAYSKTEKGNDGKYYIVVGEEGEEYTLTLALTGETAANFVFNGGTDTTAVTVQVKKVVNTWTSQDEIDDYWFGFEGAEVIRTAKFGTAAVTYYPGDVTGQADKGDAIEFSFAPKAQNAGTYTAVVSVPANDNYDGISYEDVFVVKKHGLNITDLRISGTGVSGSAADGFTVTYAPDMGLSATVKVGSAEGYAGNYSDLLGKQDTRTYLFEHSAADSDVWTDGLPKDAGTYTVRFKGMELAEGYNIDNFEFEFVSVPSVPVPSVKLTIDRAEITVTAKIPENSVVYGMTADEIRSRITLNPAEGVTLGEVTVTYNNGTAYDKTVAAGTKLTIAVSVNAENENYIAKFEGGNTSTVLTATVQKATLHVSAEDSSVLSADFVPGAFDRYAAITAKWDETTVKADDYFDVALTGYKGEVTGMTPEEIFANKEIGTYTFTVTLQADVADNFVTDPESIVYELTLGQSIVTLTVSIGNWTYGGTAAKPKFTVKASDGTEIDIPTIERFITVNYSNGSGYDSSVQPTDAGTYTLTANIVGHHDYVAENVATAKFTISPAEVTFGATLAEGAKLVYGIFTDTAAAHDLVVVTAEGYQDLPFDYSVRLSVAGGIYSETTPALTQVTVSVEVVTGPNYTAVQPDELALTVQKADQSVTVSIDGWAYGDTAKDYKIVGIMENPDLTAVYSGTTNAGEKYDSETAPKKAGKYTLTVSWKETKNYTAGKAEPVAFTVEKAKLTKPTEIGNTYTYTGAEQTYTPEGFDSDTMTISGNVKTNAGNHTVTVSVTDKYNYVWADDTDTDITFTFVIGKAEQSVNVSIADWTYGDTAKDYEIVGIMESPDLTAVYSGTTNAGVKYSSETAPTAAGSYTLTVSWAETTNYTAGSAAPVEFTVEKAKLTKPTKNGNTFTYTGAEQTYTPEGFDAATMTISGNVQTNAGKYTVTVSVTDKDNYVWADDTDTDITFTFVIGKAEQSVTVKIDGWTYGDTAKEYSVEGIMENADYTVSYSGDGYSADTAPVNAGNYTLTITVDATANYNSAVASAEFTIAPKELHVSDSVMIIEAEYGELTLDDISSDEAILAVIGDYTAIFDGLVYDDVLTPDDFTLTAAEDYSDLVADGFMAVADYSIKVALNATLTNYVVPESGLENITFRVVKAANSIGRYSVSGWTYLDVRSEYIPAFSAAVFGTVVGSFFDENGTEIAVDDFGATTPAGTYTFRLSVADSDNYSGATRTGSFVVDKRIVVAELTATDVTYDGAVYDGISYTLSFDVSDYIGTVGYEYSENGSAFRKGLPTDAGNYSVRIGEYSDSENIELRAETVDFRIDPAPMHFTVTGVDGASIEYGTAIADIDMNALIVSVIPDSYVGGFEFTVSLITANGTAYRPGLYAGTVLYATVDITLDSNNYYPVVDTAIEMLPKVNITKVSHDMAFEVNDEIITDGSSAAVIEGSANTVIDAISYYMAINDIQYYEYHITVDGEEYSRNFVWAPGSHTVEVRLSGNHEGSTQFTVVIEENPDAVDRAPFTPKTVVGEVLESINFTWASAVSIAFGVAVAVLIILFFGLRRAKRK